MPKGQPAGGTHGRRHDVVGQALRLQHGQVVLRALPDELGLGIVAVGEGDVDATRARHHVQVGEDDAGLDDHHAGAALHVALAMSHALRALLAVVRHRAHRHHRLPDLVVGLRRRGQRLRLVEHALHDRLDLLA
jgi:hypothetical protein